MEVAGPGFLNVFLSPRWCARALRDILRAGEALRARGEAERGRRYRIEFVSANPTGPLVIVNARAAAVGDALARILRSQGDDVSSEYYVNDAGNQFQALAASMETRLRQALGRGRRAARQRLPRATTWWTSRGAISPRTPPARAPRSRCPRPSGVERLGWLRRARTWWRGSGASSRTYGTVFDQWSPRGRPTCGPRGCPSGRIAALAAARPHLRGGRRALVPLDRVRRRQGPRAPEVRRRADLLRGGHRLPPLLGSSAGSTSVIDFLGPGPPRLRRADAGGDAGARSSRRGVRRPHRPARHAPARRPAGADVQAPGRVRADGGAARGGRARRGPLHLPHAAPRQPARVRPRAWPTRQSADNPVFYVQYAHARVSSLLRNAAEQGVSVPPLGARWTSTPLALPEEQVLIKRLLQYPGLVAGAARAREPHRVAYYLTELAGLFHPYYKAHRVISADGALDARPARPLRGGGAGGAERPRASRRVGAREHVSRRSRGRRREPWQATRPERSDRRVRPGGCHVDASGGSAGRRCSRRRARCSHAASASWCGPALGAAGRAGIAVRAKRPRRRSARSRAREDARARRVRGEPDGSGRARQGEAHLLPDADRPGGVPAGAERPPAPIGKPARRLGPRRRARGPGHGPCAAAPRRWPRQRPALRRRRRSRGLRRPTTRRPGGRWAVQVGAFKNRDQAETRPARLRDSGFEAS